MHSPWRFFFQHPSVETRSRWHPIPLWPTLLAGNTMQPTRTTKDPAVYHKHPETQSKLVDNAPIGTTSRCAISYQGNQNTTRNLSLRIWIPGQHLTKRQPGCAKTLGLCMIPSGNTTETAKIFTQVNKTFGLRMVGSQLQPKEVKLAHWAVHLPSQRYQFHGAPLPEKVFAKESNYLRTQLLQKLGIAWTHLLQLRYAPKNQGELALPHFYVIQGATAIKQVIQHIQLRTELGQNMLYHLKWTQTITGFQTGILTDVNSNLDYTTTTWWTQVCKFVKCIEGNLQLKQEYTSQPLWKNDYSRMKTIVGKKGYRRTTLQRINACWLFQRIMYISKIAEPVGKLSPDFLTPRAEKMQSRSELNWPT